jgi:uncharacterized protein (UPF0210 family)
MRQRLRQFAVLLLCGLILSGSLFGQAPASRPKVRTICAFVRIDRANYKTQVGDAIKVLVATRDEFVRAGYEVQTVRITTQPFADYTRGLSQAEALKFLREYADYLAGESKRIGTSIAPDIGPAMIVGNESTAATELLTEALSTGSELNASIIVSGDDGIHWNAVRAAAKLIKQVSQRSAHSQGTFNFAATAMLAPYAPFFPGSWHDGPGKKFSIGLEGAGLIEQAFAESNHDPKKAVERMTALLTEQGRVVERIGQQIEKQTGWTYLGFDPTPAPLKDVSIGAAIEKFTGVPFGSSGTMTAAALITQAVKAVPVKQVGFSGLMLPVLEDARMAQRWSEGTYNVDSLLAYSAVCGTGLDTVPLPGDVTEEQLARIIGDVASLAYKWHKPLTARLQPVAGKKAGEKSAFDDPYLVNAVLQKLP